MNMFLREVPAVRIRQLNDSAPNSGGEFVLYWMSAFRRPGWNFSLDRAVEWACELRKPLLVLETLRVDSPWASDRFHAFILQGMAHNRRAFARTPIFYYPWVESGKGEGKGLLGSLAARACVVVADDDYPAFSLRCMSASAVEQGSVLFEAVDSNGILPLAAADGRVFQTAFSFRRFLQKQLPSHFGRFPKQSLLADAIPPPLRAVPEDILKRWPATSAEVLAVKRDALSRLPIDHSIPPAPLPGGAGEAGKMLDLFISEKLPRYFEDRNHPDADATSGLSPYLHFGHISAHEILSRVGEEENRILPFFGTQATGSRSGWWRMSLGAEAFLDQLVTWRELGFNMCAGREDYDRFESLPAWAQKTLAEHAGDRRPHIHTIGQLRRAETYDPVWNAAQRQLLREGCIHNYLRMLWGKKILEWTPSPADALDIMIDLNNRYALDGRDPNSYSGILWVLGRYDRPWGPERPIFGKVRYMKSENTVRKVRMKNYLDRYAAL